MKSVYPIQIGDFWIVRGNSLSTLGQEEPGGARSCQEEPGRARGSQGSQESQEEPDGARRSQGEPG